MPIYTFSTKTKNPEDEELVKEVKEHCEKHSLNFSGVIVNLLKTYKVEQMHGRNNEV